MHTSKPSAMTMSGPVAACQRRAPDPDAPTSSIASWIQTSAMTPAAVYEQHQRDRDADERRKAEHEVTVSEHKNSLSLIPAPRHER
jgi:hypothetical protein